MATRTRFALGFSVAFTLIPSLAQADSFTPLNFVFQDNRLFTGDGDWFPHDWKAECGGINNVLGGLSRHFVYDVCVLWLLPHCRNWQQAALCVSSNISVRQNEGYTLFFGSADDRRDTSTGDWAVNLIKGECGPNDVVTGLAQTSYQIGRRRSHSRGRPLQSDQHTVCF